MSQRWNISRITLRAADTVCGALGSPCRCPWSWPSRPSRTPATRLAAASVSAISTAQNLCRTLNFSTRMHRRSSITLNFSPTSPTTSSHPRTTTSFTVAERSTSIPSFRASILPLSSQIWTSTRYASLPLHPLRRSTLIHAAGETCADESVDVAGFCCVGGRVEGLPPFLEPYLRVQDGAVQNARRWPAYC